MIITRICKTLSMTALISSGVTPEEFFDSSEAQLQLWLAQFPGPEVEITEEVENTELDYLLN